MQGYGNGINAYRQTQVGTADPRRLVIMCYENVIKKTAAAKKAYESGDYEAKGKAVANVQDTIEVLLQSLDHERGGRIALGLHALYTYCMRRLTDGDIRKDLSAFDEVSSIFEDLLASWKAMSPDNGAGNGTRRSNVKTGAVKEGAAAAGGRV